MTRQHELGLIPIQSMASGDPLAAFLVMGCEGPRCVMQN
jgi:hypothetical protein